VCWQSTKFYESKVKYLEQELETKTQALLEDRRKSSAEVLSLRHKVAELEYSLQVSDGARTQLTQQAQDLEGFLKEARRQAHLHPQATVHCVRATGLQLTTCAS
jgi:hypothetical protein